MAGIEDKSGVLYIRLDEQSVLPPGYTSDAVSPNSFLPSCSVYDFPIRERKVVLRSAGGDRLSVGVTGRPSLDGAPARSISTGGGSDTV